VRFWVRSTLYPWRTLILRDCLDEIEARAIYRERFAINLRHEDMSDVEVLRLADGSR
jgi:hypothetical protein